MTANGRAQIVLVPRGTARAQALLAAENARLKRENLILRKRLRRAHCGYCGQRACECGLEGFAR